MPLLATFIDSNSSESISIWRFLDQTESQVFSEKFVYTFVWLVCRHVKQHVDWLIKSKQSKAEEVHCFHATTRAKPMFLRESEEVIIQLAHSSSSSFDGLFLQLLIMQYHQSLFCYVPLTYYKRATASKSRQDESIGGDKKKGDSLSWSSLMMSLCRLQHGHSLAKSARLTPPFPIPSIFSP